MDILKTLERRIIIWQKEKKKAKNDPARRYYCIGRSAEAVYLKTLFGRQEIEGMIAQFKPAKDV